MDRMKNIVKGIVLLGILSGNSLFADLQLTENGKTAYRIVLPQNASDNLKYAAHELKIHLEEAAGTKFSVVKGTPEKNGKLIILREQDPKLKTGEILIRTEGNRLLLSGGGESGIHHAVHDFLETDCGYIWYDARGGKKIPDLKNFKLPEINRKKQYPFVCRSMRPDYFFHRPEGHYFLYRNGQNLKIRMMRLPGMGKNELKFNAAGCLTGNGVNDIRRASPDSHTYFDYIPDKPGRSRIRFLKGKGYFKEHPEWFSMNPEGKRIVRQLCFSDPELRAEFKKNFYEHIRQNPNMNVFSVTAYDMPGQLCHCAKCKAAIQRHQAKGAPVFLFVKELAEAVEKDFPQVRIWTYAYRKDQTEFPPKDLKLPDNVVLEFCPIDDDMTKPYDSESNAETYRNLKEWTKICKNVLLNYYVNPWTFGFTPPAVGNVRRCARDLVLAARAGVNGANHSHPIGVPNMVGFTELQSYLLVRLMRDPGLDIDSLIDDFMKFEYGPAAPMMRKYLDELEDVAKTTKVFVKWNAVYGVWKSFFKSRDVVRWQGYFDQMEKLTAAEPARRFSVQRVRFSLDIMTLRFYRRIKKEVPDYRTDVRELGERIIRVGYKAIDAFYSKNDPQIRAWNRRHKQAIKLLVDKMIIQEGSEAKSLPKEIFGKIDPKLIFEFYPEAMKKTVQVNDPEAAWNYAMRNTTEPQGCPVQFLKYDAVKSVWKIFGQIGSPKPGMEGKYCFYHAGSIEISPSFEMRLHFDGYRDLFRIFPGEVWMPGTDDTVNVYASLKFTGPKYYPGSKEPDSISCDRIVIVRKTND